MIPKPLLTLSDHAPLSCVAPKLKITKILKRNPDRKRFNKNWSMHIKNLTMSEH